MKNEIRVTGKIKFDPIDVTTKHKKQASWKKVAYVEIDGELTKLYAWLINRRYNITLNPPLRGAHVTFINDALRDFTNVEAWDSVKAKYDGKIVDVVYSPDARTNGEHWWLVIPEEHRSELHDIRTEVGLGRPNFGLHLTIGYANEKNIDHSNYIHNLLKKGLINT